MDAQPHERQPTANSAGEKSAIIPCAAGIAGLDATETPLKNSDAGGGRNQRLDRLPMRLDVILKVRSFRVEDLLALGKDTVVETSHQHSQDVPVRCGGALLVWGEFEVVDQKLAVRITRLG